MNRFSKDVIQGLREATAFLAGDREGMRVHVVKMPVAESKKGRGAAPRPARG